MKLLIIGNGFDKYCDLDSSFSDYFNYQYPNLELHLQRNVCVEKSTTNMSVHHAYIRSSNITFLEEYVMCIKTIKNHSEINWSDVESNLNSLITEKMYMESLPTEIFGYVNMPNVINSMLRRRINIIDNQNIFHNKESTKDFYKLLASDVTSFEQKFSKYLSAQFDKSKDTYHKKAASLVKQLVGETTFNHIDFCVLSFNYTKPNCFNNIKTEHVHGSLKKNNIIIGIDSTDMKYADVGYKFTKTFRKVEQFTTIYGKKVIDVMSGNYEEIIFFGHSLNKQDYSYFQTLFDQCKLYDSDVRLTFVYSLYERRTAEDIKEEQVKQVIQLIETYGEKVSYNNLLNKLLNTNRLNIVNIIDLNKDRNI